MVFVMKKVLNNHLFLWRLCFRTAPGFMLYAVYDASNPNVKIALPNKLYESVYCEIPIIVAKGTYLAEIVNQWGVGVSVSHNDPFDLEEQLKQLIYNTEKYERITENCKVHKRDIDISAANAELYAAVTELVN